MATIDINEVKQYICEHIREIHAIRDVAQHFQIMEAALRMRWKRSNEHIPLGKFISSARLELAMSLHRMNRRALCKEIAHEAGYPSMDVASRCFRRLTGKSMRDKFHSVIYSSDH